MDRAIECYTRVAGNERGRELATVRNGAILASLLARPDARARIDKAIALASARLPADHPDWGMLVQTRAILDLRLGDLDAADTDLRDALARFEREGERAQPETALTHGYIALLELRRHRVAAADAALARANRLAAFTPTSVKRVWLDEVAVEVAIAHGDAAGARRRLGSIGRTLDALPPAADAHVIAHYHLLVATVALLEHDRATATAEQARAAAALEAAEIPASAGYQDCSVCKPL